GVFIRMPRAGPGGVGGCWCGGAVALALAVHPPELFKGLFLHEPAGIASFVTAPADAKAAGDDRREMVGPASGASKAGDAAGAVPLFFDGGNSRPGIFVTLPPATQVIVFGNTRPNPPHI